MNKKVACWTTRRYWKRTSGIHKILFLLFFSFFVRVCVCVHCLPTPFSYIFSALKFYVGRCQFLLLHLDSFRVRSRRYIYGYYYCYYYSNIIMGCMTALGRLIANVCATACVCDRNEQVCEMKLDFGKVFSVNTKRPVQWTKIVAMLLLLHGTYNQIPNYRREMFRENYAKFIILCTKYATVWAIVFFRYFFYFYFIYASDRVAETLMFHFYCSTLLFDWNSSGKIHFGVSVAFVRQTAADCSEKWIEKKRFTFICVVCVDSSSAFNSNIIAP